LQVDAPKIGSPKTGSGTALALKVFVKAKDCGEGNRVAGLKM
jgi:hypothetical protein